MIFVVTLMWFGHNLLQQKKAHRNIRDVDGMKAKCNWFAFGVGKGPIDKTRANNIETTANSCKRALMRSGIGVRFKIIDVVGAGNRAARIGDNKEIIGCEGFGGKRCRTVKSKKIAAKFLNSDSFVERDPMQIWNG